MLNVRHSPDARKSRDLRELKPRRGESNKAWVARAGIEDGVLLLGGSSLVEFRIRVAQSRVRGDMLPSFWSMAGVLRNGSAVYTVADLRDLDSVPVKNGVQRVRLNEFNDPEAYPNIAIVQFCDDYRSIEKAIETVSRQRGLVDIPALIVPWIAYGWGAGAQGNPLLDGQGLPSASLVETAHALAGVDITPGLASEASCPEAIWQAAKWWTSYYDDSAKEPPTGDVRAMRPTGRFGLRQSEARVEL